MQLAALLTRRTIGILKPEIFSGRSGLPETVEKIYDLRLDSLRQATYGELAYHFLVICSFFGFVIQDDVKQSFFDGIAGANEAWNLLFTRRFIAGGAAQSSS